MNGSVTVYQLNDEVSKLVTALDSKKEGLYMYLYSDCF